MRTAFTLAVIITSLAGASAGASAASTATGLRICGQIKNGPHASFWSHVSGLRFKDGTTWTVGANRVGCGAAMNGTRTLFKQWQQAKPGARLSLKGYACIKMIDSSYDGKGMSSGGGLCHVGKTLASSIFAPDTFNFRMTGPYTIAQVKAFFHIK